MLCLWNNILFLKSIHCSEFLRKILSNGFLIRFNSVILLINLNICMVLCPFEVLRNSDKNPAAFRFLPSICFVFSVLNNTMIFLSVYSNTSLRFFIVLLEYIVKDHFIANMEPHVDRK